MLWCSLCHTHWQGTTEVLLIPGVLSSKKLITQTVYTPSPISMQICCPLVITITHSSHITFFISRCRSKHQTNRDQFVNSILKLQEMRNLRRSSWQVEAEPGLLCPGMLPRDPWPLCLQPGLDTGQIQMAELHCACSGGWIWRDQCGLPVEALVFPSALRGACLVYPLVPASIHTKLHWFASACTSQHADASFPCMIKVKIFKNWVKTKIICMGTFKLWDF